MDYYQELGLERTATVQEIRRAYKLLARLLHPDGQTDPGLKEMAERQMQRLHEMLAILSDGEARRAYDARLMAGRAESPESFLLSRHRAATGWLAVQGPRLPEWARFMARNWFWTLLALVLARVGIWCAAQGPSPAGTPAAVASWRAPKAAAPGKPSRGAAMAGRKPAAGWNPRERIPRPMPPAAERFPVDPPDRESPQPPPMAPAVQAHATAPLEALADSAPIQPGAVLVEREGVPAGDHGTEATFAGVWLSAPGPAENLLPGAYPAVYVELLLGEERGELNGIYRAEYKIPDRAVSPAVWFQVHGPGAQGTSAKLRWNSRDGAKGEMEIVLQGPNLIELSWWSTQLGRRPALASGTARLIRQQAR